MSEVCPNPIRVVVVSEHALARAGIALGISMQSDMEVAGQYDSCRAAIAAIMDSPPDAVVLEMAPGSGDVMDAIGRCHAAHPDTALVVISQTKDGELAERAIKAGVRAFVYKGVGARSLAEAIRDACRGVLHVCRCIASPMLQKTLYGNGGHKAKHPDLARLSSREFQVFQLLGNGWDNGRIARNLGISVKTLNAHQEHLKQKLAQTSTRELRTYAAAWQSQSGN